MSPRRILLTSDDHVKYIPSQNRPLDGRLQMSARARLAETANKHARSGTLHSDANTSNQRTGDVGHDIICEDCSTKRSNAAYKNTRYCMACRLLRDLNFLEDRTRPCTHCRRVFAPVSRRDALCGTCNYGSIHEGLCKLCDNEHAELYRPSISVCVKCVRDPKQRRTVISGLKIGQRARREAKES